MPPIVSVVVMGVSGSGKTTMGELLASRLGVPFVDGDDLHPAANVEKMRAGRPLTDDDRDPWLDAVGARLAEGPVVLACSALKRAYRDRLRAAAPALRLIYLRGSAGLLRHRMEHRAGHYMPPRLLESQLATLEPPTEDERPIVLDVAGNPDALASHAIRELEGIG
ncbi:MAG: gluconokinase [Micrococcales bacterium]|nr:gluconokinase [Micrococcales bacterium]